MKKKHQILDSALELFALQGFDGTPTSQIAQHAQVSEGLIFSHFGNKQQLLEAIIREGQDKSEELMAPILAAPSPQRTIAQLIDMPFTASDSTHDFWRLFFKLKLDPKYNHPNLLAPLLPKLKASFQELGYKKAQMEAELLLDIVESLALKILQSNKKDHKPFQSFLKQKYQV